MVALVPVHNDAYCLNFCLESLAPVFDRVLVLDDASIDGSLEVAVEAAKRHHNITISAYSTRMKGYAGKQLGPGDVRKKLARDARALFPGERNIFWLESDFVLRDGMEEKLRDICREGKHCLLGFTDLWADFHHGTHWGVHHETPCYIRVEPTKVNFEWFSHAHFEQVRVGENQVVSKTAGFLFFHLRSVKPDRRLLERALLGLWVKEGRQGNSDAMIEQYHGDLSPAELHVKALDFLFHSRQHKMVQRADDAELPSILTVEKERFTVLYEFDEDSQTDQPCDRIDSEQEQEVEDVPSLWEEDDEEGQA